MKVKILHITPKYDDDMFFMFSLIGLSRLVLQELVRHSYDSSFSVKSSRFTLNELKKEESFMPVCEKNIRRASEFIVFPENGQLSSIEDFDFLMENQMEQLEMLRVAIHRGIKRDVAKYLLPECYKVNLAWTVNLRSLQNFLTLRSSKHAHFEIRELAGKVFESLPSKCKELCKQCMEVKGE